MITAIARMIVASILIILFQIFNIPDTRQACIFICMVYVVGKHEDK